MQFQKKTRAGSLSFVTKVLLKFIFIVSLFVISIFLIDKINFPSPNKLIEQPISNESFKTIK
tara:strand:+ start:53 stop:238 length:186 start_codon:yes stop_codon:yes gene_type:complete